jgi:hypothetical protein
MAAKTTVKPTEAQGNVFNNAFSHAFTKLLKEKGNIQEAWVEAAIKAGDTLAVFNFYSQRETNPHPTESLA